MQVERPATDAYPNSTFPSWVEEAAQLPLAFAQVREDPLLDLWVVEQLPPNARVALIASGGCTAALLATQPNVGRLHLVDANPAQLALTRVKLGLLQESDAERLAVLGHAPMPEEARRDRLDAALGKLGLAADTLGQVAFVARVGPDHAGRYERVFAALRDNLSDHADDLAALLRLNDCAEQTRRLAHATALGRRLDEALALVMALPNLVRLFGAEATKNSVAPFAQHFGRRIRHVLRTQPASRNPYLWQMLKGCYPAGDVAPWLTVPAPVRLPEVTWAPMVMADALSAEPAGFDFVHLSNILDWLSPEQAGATLHVAAQALRPGGWLLVRQLNSTLDIPGLGTIFDWHTRAANELLARDRSFFYRALHLGRKR